MLGSYLDDLLKRATRALSVAEVDYALTGGVALVISGRDRNTRDVDVIVTLLPGSLERLIAACRDEGFSHESKDVIRLVDVTIYRFWLFLEEIGMALSLDVQCGNTAFHIQVLERARWLNLDSLHLKLATIEDLLLLKLLAFRPINRADCIHLVRLFPNIDKDYLETWLVKMALKDRWSEVRQLAGSDTC